jgi:hypothetical protein
VFPKTRAPHSPARIHDLAQDKRLGPYRDACYFGLISGTRLAR